MSSDYEYYIVTVVKTTTEKITHRVLANSVSDAEKRYLHDGHLERSHLIDVKSRTFEIGPERLINE